MVNNDIQVPGYEIEKVLGKGGMATVYLAIQKSFDRHVAIKIMAEHLSSDPSFGERFIREAKIVASLVHPNIVTVYDVGLADKHHFLSMEYIPGVDLKDCFQSLSFEQIMTVIKELSKALDFAGRKGYIHRDIKPENIMISNEDGRAVLMDFGIAKSLTSDQSMTQTGTAIGTPYYMSPEQAKGKDVDGRSDLYSLGVVLYQALVGKVPYDGDSAMSVGLKHLIDPIPSLPDYQQVLLQPLINKLLAKSPGDRFQSGDDLLKALSSLPSGQVSQVASVFNSARQQLGSTKQIPNVAELGDTAENPTVSTGANALLDDTTRIAPVTQSGIASSNEVSGSNNAGASINEQSNDANKSSSWLIIGIAFSLLLVLVGAAYFYFMPQGSEQIIKNTEQNIVKPNQDIEASGKNPVIAKKPEEKQDVIEERNNEVKKIRPQVLVETKKPVKDAILPKPSSELSSLLNSIKANMLKIPAGTYKMGIKKAGIVDAKPVHSVRIKSFYLSKFEVTEKQYSQYLKLTGQSQKVSSSQLPATKLTWLDAQTFITWLAKRSGENYRLPTESEWEYAAKLNSNTTYPWGNGLGINKANCKDCNKERSAFGKSKVGSYSPSKAGLYDMIGNVWEWTQDCYDSSYRGVPTNGDANEYAQCRRRVIRGGSWSSGKKEVIPAFRNAARKEYSSNTIGFRLARD